MENELVKIAKQGASRWNQWRKENPKATAELIGADLNGVDLSGAALGGANLAKANLAKANLSEADLSNAFLGGANLTKADLTGANLNGAFLNEADLSSARGLTQQQINSARTVEYAKLPRGIKGRHTTAEQRAKELQDLLGAEVVIMGQQPVKQKKWWQFWKK